MDLLTLLGDEAALAALGGLVSALRVAVSTSDRHLAVKLFDVCVATLCAMSAADYLTPDDVPKLALGIGLVTGSMTDKVLDTARGLAPDVTGGLVQTALEKLGLVKKQPQQQEPTNYGDG